MGTPKPCLGYASRTAAVHALKGAGLSNTAIAQRIGIDPKTVSALHANKRPAENPSAPRAGAGILLPPEAFRGLAIHAAKRGLHPNDLAVEILRRVARDGLVDAVMDDAEEYGPLAGDQE